MYDIGTPVRLRFDSFISHEQFEWAPWLRPARDEEVVLKAGTAGKVVEIHRMSQGTPHLGVLHPVIEFEGADSWYTVAHYDVEPVEDAG